MFIRFSSHIHKQPYVCGISGVIVFIFNRCQTSIPRTHKSVSSKQTALLSGSKTGPLVPSSLNARNSEVQLCMKSLENERAMKKAMIHWRVGNQNGIDAPSNRNLLREAMSR
ncbi:hypothetical protein P692DRAFT_20185391 [Suillus brevipes Sb2]|nr:hypothetical protein P692DRAFT_20185391 [Suillus brevipes Sb2]